VLAKDVELALLENLFDGVGRAGPLGRAVGPRLDLVRSIGVGYAWHERRNRQAARAFASDGRRVGYVERWTDAARELGGSAIDMARGFVEVRVGDRRVVVWNHWVPLDDIVTLKLALDKPLVHRILHADGLPVPQHAFFDVDDLEPALEFLAAHDGPCVVKPIDLQGGTVTTAGICTAAQLRRARLRARRLSQRLLIEGQVAGDNYRLLFLDGRLLDVVRRYPPRLVGDGRSSVSDLLAAENTRRYRENGGQRTWELVADLDTVFTLESQGLGPRSVPPAGASVLVKTVVNANGREFNESVRDQVSDVLVADAARAARLLGVRLAGVDVITPDCRRSLADAGGVILEVNATPGLHYHYETRNPEHAVPVLIPILQALLGQAPADDAPVAAGQPAGDGAL
jgi:D-alanine-D-alanine ligase-like ATP-grasp enzyme